MVRNESIAACSAVRSRASAGDQGAVSVDPKPEVGDRDDRDHLRNDTEPVKVSSPSTAAW